KDNDIGFGNGLMRLPGHFLKNAVFCHRLEAACIDRDEGVTPHAALAIVTIAGQTREVRHQRSAGTRDPVEQSGLADVRAANQRDHRLETGIAQFTPTNTRLPFPVCTSTPDGVPTRGESTAPPPTLRRPRRRPSLRDRKCT